MKRLSLNLEKLRTLTAAQLGTVHAGVRVSYNTDCETQELCDGPASEPPDKTITGTRGSFAATQYC